MEHTKEYIIELIKESKGDTLTFQELIREPNPPVSVMAELDAVILPSILGCNAYTDHQKELLTMCYSEKDTNFAYKEYSFYFEVLAQTCEGLLVIPETYKIISDWVKLQSLDIGKVVFGDLSANMGLDLIRDYHATEADTYLEYARYMEKVYTEVNI